MADRAQLARGEDAVGNADAQHEMLGGFALAALATDRANAVALRVNPPPLEINAGPFRRNAAAALERELTDLGDALPRILLALQPLYALRFGLFRFLCCLWHRLSPKCKKPTHRCFDW